ncbi:hypothetical protein [Acinetobacter nosocomialis]|uniref:hypothetical protein n=1 Tax=Acinetobacter nosocomialis TaxID=106654 RepID=UPI000E6AD104|nr:hypothetical protein [Acinetobacter nosocomialis]
MSSFSVLEQLYYKKNIEETPQLNIKWNLDPNDFYLSFDGETSRSISTDYPHGFVLGRVDMLKIYNNLTSISQVYDIKDFWQIANKIKALGVIGRWYNNEKITPPILSVYEDKIFLEGGNHRFNIARFYSSAPIFFIIPKEIKDRVSEIIPEVEWF